MPKFKDIDIPHLLHEFPFLVELGITGEEHTQALAFLNIREQQVLYALRDFLIKQVRSLLEHITQKRRKERKL